MVSWGWEWLVTINGVAFWGCENVVKLTYDDVCTNYEYIKNHWIAHFQKGKLYALWIASQEFFKEIHAYKENLDNNKNHKKRG